MPTADEVWAAADLLLKVKEPIEQEYHRLRATWCCSPTCTSPPTGRCTEALLDAGTTAIAYETVQLPDGALPLLAPMSEIAGRLAPQVGAYHLMRRRGRPRRAARRRARRAARPRSW